MLLLTQEKILIIETHKRTIVRIISYSIMPVTTPIQGDRYDKFKF